MDEIVIVSVERRTPDPAAGLLLCGSEVTALAAGVDADRAWSSDLRGWLDRKRSDPAYRITAFDVLAGAQPGSERAASLGEVLTHFGLELVRVEIIEAAAAEGVRQAA